MDAVLDALGGKANRFSKAYLQNMEDIIVRQTQLLFGLPDGRKRDDKR